jgi:pSer/pThr/pTyr-binding forkhead associated (FHA) protein
LGAARVATPIRAEHEGAPFSGEEEATLVGTHPRALGRQGALEEVARLGALFSSPQAPAGSQGPAPLGPPAPPALSAPLAPPAPPALSAPLAPPAPPAPALVRPGVSEDSSDKLDLQRLDETLQAIDRAAAVTPSQPLAVVSAPLSPPALPTMTPTAAQPAVVPPPVVVPPVVVSPVVVSPVVVSPVVVSPPVVAPPRPGGRHEPSSNARTEVAGKPLRVGAVRLVLLDEDGAPREARVLEESRAILGREDADVLLADDPTVSPWHAQLVLRRSGVFLKDLQSRNGVFVRVTREAALEDGDVILLGRQRLLFRDRWDAPRKGDDGTVAAGSEPTAGPARLLLQLAGGDVGALYFVGAGLSLGRDWGDVVFPSDAGLKREHAELRRKNDQHWLRPLDPSAEVFRAIRAEVELQEGDTFLVGRTRLRVSLER